MAEIGSDIVADMIGCTKKYVGQLVREKGLPVVRQKKGRGGSTFDARAVVDWIVSQEVSGDDEHESLTAQQTRVAHERADKLAIENELKRGQICHTEHSVQLGMEAVALLREEMANLGRLAHELASVADPNRCQIILEDEGRRILTDYSDAMAKLGQPEGMGAATS